MNLKAGLFLLGIFFHSISFSQDAVKKKNISVYKFHSYNSVQLLTGSTTNAASLHSVNGFSKGKFFGGVGTGFDYYYKTTIPLFAEARFDIAGTDRKFQLFANGGFHIPFGNINKKEPSKKGDFKTGKLLAAGLDYYIPFKSYAFIVGIAYRKKTVTQIVDNNVWNPVLIRIENIPIKEVYSFNRVWIRVGYVF